jgi:hypothetical protein
MANSAIALPVLLTDPGFLYWAPLGSALPTGVSAASAFSDTWPVAWIPLGMTASGTDFDPSTTASPILAAELVDPIAYRTTARTGTLSFQLLSVTATNLSRAFNGATTAVTGAGATTITKIDPPAIGTEVRAMIGFESLDSTFRFIAYQVFNSGDIKLSFNKAPATTSIPWTGMLEKPASTQPWSMWTAGVARA